MTNPPPAVRGSHRRAILQAGAIGLAGLTLPRWLAARESLGAVGEVGHEPGFGRARRCLLIFNWGGPSHLDTFDPKPLAPDNVRGPFKTIATNVPGIDLSEHYRLLAQHADKLAIVRSMTHDDPAHLSSVHTLLTGYLPRVNKSDAEPPSDRDSPHIGSVVAKLMPAPQSLPSFVTMPWIVSHPAAPGGQAPGQRAGWLGQAYDPFVVGGDPNQPGWQVPALSLLDGQSPARLGARRSLLAELDRQQRAILSGRGSMTLQTQQAQAFELLTSAAVRGAFDLEQEPAATRDRYGRHIHGQCVLLARRLLEHGVPLVSVNWHNDGGNFWDTHGNNFPRLQHDLIPPSDRAFSALLEDLSLRGLLDDTLVVMVGEFGRHPRINASAGRDHYPGCYSAVFAGGGVQGGRLYGASDSLGFAPSEHPVNPRELTATMYHALGIPREQLLHDAVNRPQPVYGASPLLGLF